MLPDHKVAAFTTAEDWRAAAGGFCLGRVRRVVAKLPSMRGWSRDCGQAGVSRGPHPRATRVNFGDGLLENPRGGRIAILVRTSGGRCGAGNLAPCASHF